MDRRRVLATVGAALGIIGAIAALVVSPWAAVVAAIGALVAAAGSVISLPADPVGGDQPVGDIESTSSDPVPAISAEPEPTVRTVESSRLATAAAPSAASPNTGPRPDAVPAFPSGGDGPASALTDPLTGLFSQDYFDVAIEARIAAARRHLRPVGVVILEVVQGLRAGRIQPTDPQRVADAINETLREADTACRRSDGRFALLLEDTPENGAIWTAERIRRFLAERDPTLTMWAGVACYPAHGFSAEMLLNLADAALTTAQEWRQDRIEVAVSE